MVSRSWLDKTRSLVLLAPMDGYTDPPFRRFIKKIAPQVTVFSEFLAATLVAKKPSLAETLFKIYPDEGPVVIQLYGKDPEDFGVAAVLAESQGAAGVDINMGCPAKKVVAHRHGSALMQDIKTACDIVAKVKNKIKIPVSVKTRLGWEDEHQLIPFVQQLCDAGLDAITIHGRTYRQKFEGAPRWEPIYQLKRAVNIPVFGNGDITDDQTALARLGPLDGVMIGRGAIADPWLMTRVCDAFAGNTPVEQLDFDRKTNLWKNFACMMVDHAGAHLEKQACHRFRKFLVRLHRELQLAGDLRKLAVTVACLDDVHKTLDLFAKARLELAMVG